MSELYIHNREKLKQLLSTFFGRKVQIGDTELSAVDEKKIALTVIVALSLVLLPIIYMNSANLGCFVVDFIGLSHDSCKKLKKKSYPVVATHLYQETHSSNYESYRHGSNLEFAYLNTKERKDDFHKPKKNIKRRPAKKSVRRKSLHSAVPSGELVTARIALNLSTLRPETPVVAINTVDVLDYQGKNIMIPRGAQFIGRMNQYSSYEASDRVSVGFHAVKFEGKTVRISALALGSDGKEGVLGKLYKPKKKKFLGNALSGVLSGLGASIPVPGGEAASEISRNLVLEARNSARRGAEGVTEELRNSKQFVEISRGTPLVVMFKEKVGL